jgi:hypothetical protein
MAPESNGFLRFDTWILVACAATCVAIFVLFSDLKGIWTDEGARLAIMNGNRLFSARQDTSIASSGEVLKAVQTSNYQPLYYLLQNSVIRIAKSHNFVLLRSVNIAFLGGGIALLIFLSRRWPLLPRVVLILGTVLNGYLMMHVLQIREYSLGCLFLLLVYLFAYSLFERGLRPISSAEIGRYSAFGLIVGIAALNSFWIVPAVAGAVTFLLMFSRKPGGTFARLLLSLAVFGVIMLMQEHLIGFAQKVRVGHWGNTTWPAFWNSLDFGVSFFITGQDTASRFAKLAAFGFVVLNVIATLLLFPWRNGTVNTERTDRSLLFYALLSVFMIASLFAFQLLYFIVERDTLAVWPRYFFQHYVLFHILVSCQFCYAFIVVSDRRVAGLARLFIWGWAGLLLLAVTYWSLTSSMGYYRDPFADTGMNKSCNWRKLSSRIKSTVAEDVLVFSRILEGATITASQYFDNLMFIWDNIEKAPEPWPSRLVILDFSENWSHAEDVNKRIEFILQRGFRIASNNRFTANNHLNCNIAVRVIRAERP